MAGELQLVAADLSAEAAFRLIDNPLRELNLIEVQDLMTLGADEVSVGRSVIVVPLQAVDHADGLDDPLFLEHGDVPVDGAKAQIRDLRLELLINPISRGVTFCAADALENGITLFAALFHPFHVPPFLRTILVYSLILTQSVSFVKRQNKKNSYFYLSFSGGHSSFLRRKTGFLKRDGNSREKNYVIYADFELFCLQYENNMIYYGIGMIYFFVFKQAFKTRIVLKHERGKQNV